MAEVSLQYDCYVIIRLTRQPADSKHHDKHYKRYAAVVDKVLALFDTTLEEWADYISFLNKLLKVRWSLPLGW